MIDEENDINIPCCIVDDHCDIVPFVHSFYRSKKVLLDSDVILLHIDAHPDLSIPSAGGSFSIEDWNTVDTLYEILAEPGGIAEFIIPLFTKRLLSQMIWVKSAWSNQLPDGYGKFSVGDTNGVPKVNWCTPYYLDDLAYSEKIKTHSPINLTTCTAASDLFWDSSFLKVHDLDPPSSGTANRKTKSGKKMRYVLDICLDYFSTHNPFIDMFRQKLLHDVEEKEKVDEYIAILKDVWSALPFRHPVTASRWSKNQCLSILRTLHIDDNETNRQAVLSMMGGDKNATIRVFVFDIMPCMSTDTMELYLDQGQLLLLPHHPIHDVDVLKSALSELENFLVKFAKLFISSPSSAESDQLPLFITIARSSSDGYTSAEQVAFLEQETLKLVDKVLNLLWQSSDSKQSRIVIKTHDLSDDPIRGAYQLLLPKQYASEYIESSSSNTHEGEQYPSKRSRLE